MSAYLEIAKKQFKVRWMYRSNFYLSIIGNIFYFFVMINVWQALYQTNDVVNGIRFSQMITYTIVTNILTSISHSGIAFTIASQVKDGTIGNELAKPIDYKLMHISRELGTNLLMTVCVFLPAAILMGCIYGFPFSGDTATLVLFAVSAVLGAAISYTIAFLFGVMAFWLKTAEYASFLSGACRSLFSGAIVPLWFYPEALRNVAMCLPFRFVTFEPIAIFLGSYSLDGALQVIGYQLLWLAALMTVEHFLWSRIQKYLVIQGG